MGVKNRGFASLSLEQRSQMGKKGADASKKNELTHRWSSEAAKAASQKGLATRRKRKAERTMDMSPTDTADCPQVGSMGVHEADPSTGHCRYCGKRDVE